MALGQPEVDADRLGVADVEVAVGLGREARVEAPSVLAGGAVREDALLDEVGSLGDGIRCGGVAHGSCGFRLQGAKMSTVASPRGFQRGARRRSSPSRTDATGSSFARAAKASGKAGGRPFSWNHTTDPPASDAASAARSQALAPPRRKRTSRPCSSQTSSGPLDQQGLAAARTVPLARLLIGLGIEHVGEETARLLAKHLRTVVAVQTAKEEGLLAIDGIGEIVAAAILSWQKNPHEQDLLRRLLQYINITNDEAVSSTKLEGKSFVFTGSLITLSRDEASELVRAHGGMVSSAVSKKTAYVVAGTDPGSKLNDAKKHEVTVLSEEEFKALVA